MGLWDKLNRRGGQMKVLIVDPAFVYEDEAIAQLEREDYYVISARDAFEGWGVLKGGIIKFDLLLLSDQIASGARADCDGWDFGFYQAATVDRINPALVIVDLINRVLCPEYWPTIVLRSNDQMLGFMAWSLLPEVSIMPHSDGRVRISTIIRNLASQLAAAKAISMAI